MVQAMTGHLTPLHQALMAAQPLPEGDGAPDWITLIPAGVAIRTHDGRGPYRVEDAAAVVAASMAEARIDGDMVIDVNHATDHLAGKGGEAPARGWIKELQARGDGSIWGRVAWTDEGRALVAGRAYRGISPVFVHDAKGVIRSILRAALTNIPNLRGLPALNMESSMTFQARLAAKLGLRADASEDDVLAAAHPATDTALQAALAEIGVALGVEGAEPRAVVTAAKLLRSGTADAVVLQAENTSLRGRIDAIEAAAGRARSEAWFDGKVRDKVQDFNAGNREERIAMHMAHPDVVEKLTSGNRTLGATHLGGQPPGGGGGAVALSAEQVQIARMLGVPEADYLKSLNAQEAR